MNPLLSGFAGLLNGGPLAIVIKATIVLAITACVALALGRASAAFRHLAWLLGLSSCAALALLAPAAPTIAVDVPAATTQTVPRLARARAIELAPRKVIDVVDGRTVDRRDRRFAESPIAAEIAGASRGSRLYATVIASAPWLVMGVWLLGCLVVLARCIAGHRRVGQIIDAAEAPGSPSWIGVLESASYDLGLMRDVELLVSDELSAPITSGFTRPVVILPSECMSWTEERRRIVLVHELAHIARLDYLAQLAATVACAIFWFHPAVWFAAARLRAEAEHAADDRVLEAGTLGLTYATHLLELARGNHGVELSPAVAVGMIRSSRLEGRFRAMLDSTRSRAAVSPRVQVAAAALMVCAMIPAAGLRTVARATPLRVAHVSPFVGEPTAITITTASTTTSISTSSPVIATTITSTPIQGEPVSVASTVIQAADDSTFEKTIDAAAGERLSFDLRTGGSVVLHGWNEPRIRLVARLSGRDWRDTRVDFTRESGVVRLRTDFSSRREDQYTSHRFELWVPQRMNVEMSSAGGSLAISDLSGEFSGHTGGGAITIEHASGSSSLSTGGGTISVTNSDLSGVVSTGGGEVYISNVTGGLRGSSGSGPVIMTDGNGATTIGGSSRGIGRGVGTGTTVITKDGVTIRSGEPGSGFGGRYAGSISTTTITSGSGEAVTKTYPGGFATSYGVGEGRSLGAGAGSYSISKAGGQIVLDDLPNGATLHTGGGQIIVRSSGGSVVATTGGGDVELQRIAGDASVSTGAGDVHISIVNTNRSEHSVEVYSGNGRVILDIPANLDARIELETAYTDNFNRRTTIESDIPLEQSETTEWDDRYGSPRKYVRARGVVGSGAGLIRVRTVNGDVVLRRR